MRKRSHPRAQLQTLSSSHWLVNSLKCVSASWRGGCRAELTAQNTRGSVGREDQLEQVLGPQSWQPRTGGSGGHSGDWGQRSLHPLGHPSGYKRGRCTNKEMGNNTCNMQGKSRQNPPCPPQLEGEDPDGQQHGLKFSSPASGSLWHNFSPISMWVSCALRYAQRSGSQTSKWFGRLWAI
jgi:hypothetical protein